MRNCTKCQKDKDNSEFYAYKVKTPNHYRTLYRRECKECMKARNKKYQEKHRDYYRKKSKEYYKLIKESNNEKNKTNKK